MEYAIAENRIFSTHDIFWRSCGHGIQSEDRGLLPKKKSSVVTAEEVGSMWRQTDSCADRYRYLRLRESISGMASLSISG